MAPDDPRKASTSLTDNPMHPCSCAGATSKVVSVVLLEVLVLLLVVELKVLLEVRVVVVTVVLLKVVLVTVLLLVIVEVLLTVTVVMVVVEVLDWKSGSAVAKRRPPEVFRPLHVVMEMLTDS